MATPWQELESIPAPVGLPSIGEYAEADDSPLLKVEWNILSKRAHLTARQYQSFYLYHVYGFSLRMTADAMGLDESTIRFHLKAAYSRLSRIPHHGLLTVLIETFGVTDVMQALYSGNGRRTPEPTARTLTARR